MNFTENQTDMIRKNLAVRLLSSYFKGTLEEEIDTLPVMLHPRKGTPVRCCVHKDRAITRYRILSLLGADVEQDDDIKPMREYLKEALDPEIKADRALTMLQEACRSCSSGKHFVTDMCQGCVAQYCRSNCPKDAIKMVNGHARIDEKACVNCGKCRNVCPYNAIIYVPIPCEDVCPVGAIQKDESGVAHIDYDSCIACGKCQRSCPFGAVEIRSDLFNIAPLLTNPDVHVSALFAPSIAGQFPGSVEQIVSALYKTGFNAVYEVSAGADVTAENEAEELEETHKEGRVLGTSCCPAYVDAVYKHVPEFEKNISHTRTPASYTGEMAKHDHKETVTVFIGPCVAKKVEGSRDPMMDHVITFDELGSLFISLDIDVHDCEAQKPDNRTSSSEARNFAVSSGVYGAVMKKFSGDTSNIKAEIINGLDRKSLMKLKMIGQGKIPCDLVEVMSCEGGCISGPGCSINPRISQRKHREYVEQAEEEVKQPEAG